MSIATIFESGQHKQEKSHLKNLIMIAQADGEIDEKELALIEKMANRYNVGRKEILALCKETKLTAITPPVEKEERYQRMYNLSKMAMADGVLEFHELALLQKYAVGIGFPVSTSDEVVSVVCKLLSDGVSQEEIYAHFDQILDL